MNTGLKILGINGLGVLPSACLIDQGNLIAMAEEERFTRLKGSFGMMPGKAVKFCLEYADLKLSDIDYISFGWNCDFYTYKMPLFLAKQYLLKEPKNQQSSNVFKVISELVKYNPSNVKRKIKEMFLSEGVEGKIPPIKFIPHHLSHAASAFYVSGFEKAHVLVLDGSGENKCTSIWKGNGSSLEEVESFKIPDSLGWFYQSITEFLGFTPNSHEGKTMALAAYGKPNKRIKKHFSKIITYDKAGNYCFNAQYSFTGKHSLGNVFSDKLVDLLGKPRKRGEAITQNHKDIAYATQNILEDIVLKLVNKISSYPGFNGNLCLAGGIGLNCKMNGAIAKLKEVKKLYVPPVSSDAGSSLGAALALSVELEGRKQKTLTKPYWGGEYSDENIEKLLTGLGIKYSKPQNIALKSAELLEKNKIIGWFQGRMEIGSRALGARSILANPLVSDVRDFINEKVKGRENWRPFAASILHEKRTDFFDMDCDSPFMAIAYELNKEMAKKLPSAVHIDSTTRPQIVKKEASPLYWELINHFGKLTDIYAVLNTSFNLSEEPIVCTPEQALKSFYASGMDALAMGSFLIQK